MSISFRKAFKNFFKVNTNDQDSYYKNSNQLDPDEQNVLNIIKLMPLAEFDDGIEKSAFFLNPKLLSSFLGVELGGVISDISNGFDFGFETN